MLPWETSKDIPWRMFTSPVERWQTMPTFVVCEWLFIAGSLLSLAHARANGRRHLLVWVSAFLTGVANDIFFMALPVVDNFWHSQASIMVTPRLPLYIACLYNVFLYFATVTAWRARLPALAEAALAGLVGELLYAPFDICGARLLWWTWHDTDASVLHRVLGAPISSSQWVITFTATFALLHRRLTKDRGGLGGALRSLLLNALFCTPIMMVQMVLAGLLDGQVPCARSIAIVIGFYFLLVLLFWSRKQTSTTAPLAPRFAADSLLWWWLVVYGVCLTALMAVGVPEAHISTGLHQTYGPCNVKAIDLNGNERLQYICREEYNEDFRFDCGGPQQQLAHHQEWYTICGTPHTNYQLYVGAVAALAAAVALVYGFLLAGDADNSSKDKKKRV